MPNKSHSKTRTYVGVIISLVMMGLVPALLPYIDALGLPVFETDIIKIIASISGLFCFILLTHKKV